MSSKINSIFIYIIFILSEKLSVHGITFSTVPLSSKGCICMPLNACTPFSQLLLSQDEHEREMGSSLVLKTYCGFRRLEILVCCPNDSHRSMRNADFDRHHSFWHSHHQPNYDSETNFFNYIDAESLRNRPPVSYNPTPHHHQYNYNIMHDSTELKRNIDTPKDHEIVFPGDPRIRPRVHIPAPLKPTDGDIRKTPRNSAVCGITANQRIIGGEESTVGQFPWLARLAYLNTTSNETNYRCAGSVISDHLIITAAHCVSNLVNDLNLSYVLIGDNDDCTIDIVNCKFFSIDNVFVHPDHANYINDIALIRFNNPNNVNFISVCLPVNYNSTLLSTKLIDQIAVAAGWSSNIASVDPNTSNIQGNNNNSDSTSTVRKLNLPIVNRTLCADTYARFSRLFKNQIVISSGHLCAQGQLEQGDVCQGDSGAPLMDAGNTDLFNNSGRYTLLGIVAFGPTACGTLSIPGVYTFVSSYMDWIFSYMN